MGRGVPLKVTWGCSSTPPFSPGIHFMPSGPCDSVIKRCLPPIGHDISVLAWDFIKSIGLGQIGLKCQLYFCVPALSSDFTPHFCHRRGMSLAGRNDQKGLESGSDVTGLSALGRSLPKAPTNKRVTCRGSNVLTFPSGVSLNSSVAVNCGLESNQVVYNVLQRVRPGPPEAHFRRGA